jgi:hypothetical protein
MEELIKDYLWFEYEGKIITEIYKKCILWKGDNNWKNDRMNKLFKPDDLQNFYILGLCSMNIYSLLLVKEKLDKETFIERFIQNKKNLLNVPIEEYHIQHGTWRYENDLNAFKLLLQYLQPFKE